MENASKALIIAGAVLISIVLISLGVVLISRSGDSSGAAKNTTNVITQQTTEGVNKIDTTTRNLFSDM